MMSERDQQCNRLCEIYSRSHGAVIRVYDEVGNVIARQEHAGDFKES